MSTASAPSVGARALAVAASVAAHLLFVGSLGYFGYFLLGPVDRLRDGASPLVAATADLALFTVFALHHSVFARPAVKRLLDLVVPPELVRTLYVGVSGSLFWLVCLLWQPFGPVLWDVAGIGPALMLRGFFWVGVALTLAAAWALDFGELYGGRQVYGYVTGASRARPVLNERSLYRIVRHPLYFAWLLLVWASPRMTAGHAWFSIVSVTYLLLAIPLEERNLIAVFGDEYRRYQQRVRKRLVPYVY